MTLAEMQTKMLKIAKANAVEAFDQIGQFAGNERHAYASYLINALDTMAEEGIRAPRTSMYLMFDDAFIAENGRLAAADALDDFNYVGSRHHY